jgi:type I restriction enzyme S subunit
MGNGKIAANDIVLTSRGSLGHIGWYNSIIQKKIRFALVNSGTLIFRSKYYMSPGFITQILKSPLGKMEIDFISFGSAQPQLTKKSFELFNHFSN